MKLVEFLELPELEDQVEMPAYGSSVTGPPCAVLIAAVFLYTEAS